MAQGCCNILRCIDMKLGTDEERNNNQVQGRLTLAQIDIELHVSHESTAQHH
jgi:hypothetical protein